HAGTRSRAPPRDARRSPGHRQRSGPRARAPAAQLDDQWPAPGGRRGMSQAYDYGSSGIVGIATPQANPTVEAEMRILLPPTILPVTARLTSRAGDSETRLRDYLRDLASTIAQLDTLRPYALGFACTGSSYLVEPGEAERIVDATEARFGYPVVTA